MPDYAWCSAPDDRSLWGQDVLLEHLSEDHAERETNAHGRWIGMLRTRAAGRRWIEDALDRLSSAADINQLSMRDLMNDIISAGHPVRVIYVHGHWLDINSVTDLEQAGVFTAGQR